MKRKTLVIAVVPALFMLSLVPGIYRTLTWAGDAYGLVALATMPEGKISFNPYASNGYLLDQEMAVWLLEHTDYPYQRCSRLSATINLCGTSLVNWVGRSLDFPGIESERAYRLLDVFIARGESLNELSNGLAPVHEAVLYNNPAYMEVLLGAGADLETRIDKPGKEYHGYTAVQFLLLLEGIGKTDYGPLWDVLEKERLP